MQRRSWPAVPYANSRARHPTRAACLWKRCFAWCVVIGLVAGENAGHSLECSRLDRQGCVQSASAHTTGAAPPSVQIAQTDTTRHMLPSIDAVHRGRSLQQVAFDPYGIGYYDPYQSGVTPGFVNVDLNRETGLHVDVGTVAVDVSADKNYYGLGVGNLVGMGAAKDRGWNLQLGGGNILDVSVTKDAGLGLWLLNGLANIQIGPDGRGWETGHIAAQSVPGQAATAATAAAAAAQGPQPVTSVVVDDPAADHSDSGTSNSDAADAPMPGVHVSSDTAAAAAEEPIITEEPINFELSSAAGASSEANMRLPSAARPAAVHSRRSRPVMYVQPKPEVVVVAEGEGAWTPEAQQLSSSGAPQAAALPSAAVSTAITEPAAQSLRMQVPATDQRQVATGPGGITTGHKQVLVTGAPSQYVPMPALTAAGAAMHQQPAMAAAAAPRRACEGGTLVAVAGNKFKCRYKRSRPEVMQ